MLGFQSPFALPDFSPSGAPLEAVFLALDGQECEIDGYTCHVAVYGIWDAGGHRWVQLALDGNHHRMLTVRLEPADHGCALVSLAVA